MVSQEGISLTELSDVDSILEASNLQPEEQTLPIRQECDSIRTHVTETPLSDLDPLQPNELVKSQCNRTTVSPPNEPRHGHLIANEPDYPKPVIFSLHPPDRAPRYVGRKTVQSDEPLSFSFAQALKPTVDYSRRVGRNNVDSLGNTHVSTEFIRHLSNHEIINRYEKLPQSKLPKNYSELVVPLQISAVSEGLINHDPNPKCPELQVSHTVEIGPNVHSETSVAHKIPNQIEDTIVFSQLPEIKHPINCILPLPQASAQTLQPKYTPIPGRDCGIRRQALSGAQGLQSPFRATVSLGATRSCSVLPNVLKEIPDSRSRVAKVRRKSKTLRHLPGHEAPAQSFPSETMPTEEDLLQILLYRNQQEKKARDFAKAVHQTKEAELQNTKRAYTLLRSQMEEVSKREILQRTELAKYEKVLPGWKIKARKLEDYLKGLTNDHHKLRDDAQSMQRQQLVLRNEKAVIIADIEEARSAIECHTPGITTILSEARHQIDLLNQSQQAQARRAQENAELLGIEQERSQKLEQEISKISSNQQQMIDFLHVQRSEMIEKLSEALKSKSTMLGSESVENQACTMHLLDRCTKMLEELKTIEYTQTDDLQRLDSSIKGYAQHMNSALQQVAETSQSTSSNELELNRHIQKQLSVIETSLRTEQYLSDQILDLREIGATMRERLQTSESSLAEAHQNIIELEGKEQDLKSELSSLKAEILILRAQPAETPTLVDRLCKAESRNSELESTMAKNLMELSQREVQMQRQSKEAVEKQKITDGLASQIDDAKVMIHILEKQKVGCEKQADLKYENLRSQLLEATNAERAILTNEHLITVEKLQRQKSKVEGKLNKIEEDAGRLRTAKEIDSKRLGELQKELCSLQTQIQSRSKELHDLDERFQAMEEKLLAQIQKHKEDKLKLDHHIVETNTRLAVSLSEAKSRDEKNLSRINAACRKYNPIASVQNDFDLALDTIIQLLTEPKEPPRTPLLKGISSQGISSRGIVQQLVSSNRLRERIPVASEDELSGQKLDEFTFTSQSRQNGPLDLRTSRQSQSEVVVQESQIQKSTVYNSFTTTKSSRATEPNKRISLHTLTKESENPLETSLFDDIDQAHCQSFVPSPRWDSAELSPPTPIPFSIRAGNHSQLASTTGSQPTIFARTITGLEDQSVGAAYGPTTAQKARVLSHKIKRSAADFGMTPRAIPAKRRISGLETQGLGPIIPDSQSPSKSMRTQADNKARKSRRQTQLDKYAARFHGVR